MALSLLPGQAISHWASLYTDDVIILVAPGQDDLNCVHQILQLFAGAFGLVTNIDKCVATPIRCTDEMITEVQEVYPRVLAPFPCKYLGIPLSLKKLRQCEEQVLVDKVAARILTWKSRLLTHTGCVLLTKVTLLAIPVQSVLLAVCPHG